MPDGTPTTPEEGTPRPRREPRPRPARQPDVAARRMLVSTVAITAVVAAAVFVWSVVRGGDDGPDATDVSWDAIAAIDRTTGAITTFDADGQTDGQVPSTTRVRDVYAHGDRVALVGSSSITIAHPSGDDAPQVIEIPPRSVVQPIETATTLHLLVGDETGGNLLIVDVEDGSVIDVGAAAAPTVPRLFVDKVRVSEDGTAFAVADAANFQTIVVRDGVDGAVFLADQPVAVGDELVATSQVVNLQADISLVTLERRSEAVVPTELPSGGVMVDDELVMVSIDGGVFRIGPGDQEAERLGTVAIPAGSAIDWTLPADSGERLVVGGNGFVVVVDLDGATQFTTTFAAPTDPLRPHPAWRCLPVGGEDAGHSIVDLETGEQLADLTGMTIADVSADGCTVVGERAGAFQLVRRDGVVRLGVVRDVAVAPDGDAVVWTTSTGTTQLVTVGDDLTLADPIELAGAPGNLAVTFLRD